jgi:hypothetical protein
MISDFKFQIPNSLHSGIKLRSESAKGFYLLLFTLCLLLSACSSVPNLELPECTDSRGVVKEFYSYHLGNEMKFSPANLKLREKFLTPEYFKSLQNLQTENDVFTTNNLDFPKTFRIGKCEIVSPEKTNVEVVLFWKDDTRSEQREIKAEVIKQQDKWLINKIFN